MAARGDAGASADAVWLRSARIADPRPQGSDHADRAGPAVHAFGLMLIVVDPGLRDGLRVRVALPARTGKHDVYEPDWGYSAWMDAAGLAGAGADRDRDRRAGLGRHPPARSLREHRMPTRVRSRSRSSRRTGNGCSSTPSRTSPSVNELVFPSEQPLSLQITSDTVMNSFLIPALGGQIYAMAGMQTRLNLLADEPGRFAGRNMQYSGDGFANQQFEAIAMSGRISTPGSPRSGSRRTGWMPPPTSSSPGPASCIR